MTIYRAVSGRGEFSFTLINVGIKKAADPTAAIDVATESSAHATASGFRSRKARRPQQLDDESVGDSSGSAAVSLAGEIRSTGKSTGSSSMAPLPISVPILLDRVSIVVRLL